MSEPLQRPARLILWGWGTIYNRLLDKLRYFCAVGEIEIVAITGTTVPPYDTLDGYPVVRPDEIPGLEYDYIMVISLKGEKQIIARALTIPGVRREQIFPHRAVEQPYFSFREYFRLKESGLTIISNHCWGGMASNTLGIMNRSPFKNLYLLEEEYLRVLADLEHYCREAVPVFSRWKTGREKEERVFPVLRLDDVDLYCNHVKSADEAIAQWMDRRGRMAWESLFVEFYTESREMEAAFAALEQYPRKVCFVPFEPAFPCSIQIPITGQSRYFYEAVLGSVDSNNLGFPFSLMRLLLGEEPVARGAGKGRRPGA